VSQGRGKSTLVDGLKLLAPLFGGTDEQLEKRKKELARDVEEQVDRRRRVLNAPPPAIDTEGEAVEDDERQLEGRKP